jgi:hypothetical protein
MSDRPDAAVTEALQSVLDQVVTMKVAAITYTPRDGNGTLAHVAVEGGTHEILCELGSDGQLLSARVIEMD